MASGYKIKGNDLYDLYHQYADCAQTSFTNYKIDSSNCLKLVPYSSVDTWTNKLELSGYRCNGTPITIPEPGTKPAFNLFYTLKGPTDNDVLYQNYKMKRTDTSLIIGDKTFTKDDFVDKAIPKNILVICCAGGGQGAYGDWDRDGAGGGGGAFWCGIIEVTTYNNFTIQMKQTYTEYNKRGTSQNGYDGGGVFLWEDHNWWVDEVSVTGGSGALWINSSSGRTNTGGAGGTVKYYVGAGGESSTPPSFVKKVLAAVAGGKGGDSTSNLTPQFGGHISVPQLDATNVPTDKVGVNIQAAVNRSGGLSGRIYDTHGGYTDYYGAGGGGTGIGWGGNGGQGWDGGRHGVSGQFPGGGGGGGQGKNWGGGGGGAVIYFYY